VKGQARSQLKCACGGLAGASALCRRLDVEEEENALVPSLQVEQQIAADGGVCAFLICLCRLCTTVLRRANGEVDGKRYHEPGPASSGRLTEYSTLSQILA
jgi:hypothetical protein